MDLPEALAGLAARHGIAPAQVVLEVTESGLLQDSPAALDILERMCAEGIDLSIDEFIAFAGTAYRLMRASTPEHEDGGERTTALLSTLPKPQDKR